MSDAPVTRMNNVLMPLRASAVERMCAITARAAMQALSMDVIAPSMAVVDSISGSCFIIEGLSNMPREAIWPVHLWRREGRSIVCALTLIVMAPLALAATAGQKHFASPEEGITALVEAIMSNDE